MSDMKSREEDLVADLKALKVCWLFIGAFLALNLVDFRFSFFALVYELIKKSFLKNNCI